VHMAEENQIHLLPQTSKACQTNSSLWACDHIYSHIFFRVWLQCDVLPCSWARVAQQSLQSSGPRWSVCPDSMNTLVDACSGH
jgi:hypothetical protein